jgi:hypothetical protein
MFLTDLNGECDMEDPPYAPLKKGGKKSKSPFLRGMPTRQGDRFENHIAIANSPLKQKLPSKKDADIDGNAAGIVALDEGQSLSRYSAD